MRFMDAVRNGICGAHLLRAGSAKDAADFSVALGGLCGKGGAGGLVEGRGGGGGLEVGGAGGGLVEGGRSSSSSSLV